MGAPAFTQQRSTVAASEAGVCSAESGADGAYPNLPCDEQMGGPGRLTVGDSRIGRSGCMSGTAVSAILIDAGSRPTHSRLPRRGAGVAEQGCLLSSYTSKGCRGFESPPLRHFDQQVLRRENLPATGYFKLFCTTWELWLFVCRLWRWNRTVCWT
jgi:hypothetical protein